MARAYNQAQKFGAEMAIPDQVVALARGEGDGSDFVLTLVNNEQARARAIVIASGADYRRLDVEHVETFEGGSVHYLATQFEAKLCASPEVALLGGGNLAGPGAA